MISARSRFPVIDTIAKVEVEAEVEKGAETEIEIGQETREDAEVAVAVVAEIEKLRICYKWYAFVSLNVLNP